MAPNYPRIGFAIRKARLAKGLSQDELARRIGAKGGRHTVIRWEQGLHLPTKYVEGLVRELGLAPELFEDEDEDEGSTALSRELTSTIDRYVEHRVGRALSERS